MVARTPPRHRKSMVAPPLSPTLLRDTLLKVDQCMTRLQELQYTATGGNKVVNGVKLSPRSTKAYFKTSLRCKQESMMRIKNNGTKRSPSGKLQPNLTGEWRSMSLKSMLVGETVAEILQVSKFTKEIMANSNLDDPKTPLSRKQRPNQQKTPIETRRKREKQHRFRVIQAESLTPSMKRARSRINFKVSPPKKSEFEKEKVGFSARYVTNKVSPKHKPWAKKTVLFPNPLFHSSPTSQHQNFCKTNSPVIIGKRKETPHKFLVKSPVKIKSPQHKGFVSVSPVSKLTALSRISPPKQHTSKASKLRRSLSPSRLANRLVSPLKGRRNSMASSCDGLMNDLRHKPPALMMMPMRFSASRMAVERGN
ncbi:microtubule-binding protein TANGLED isoform X2 [Silene latifolia]|uniref:microtubule-binding protein TANGLED isoform X2 n=1 Tax=Silene latifolia TaxID=37657 RepID=UPI003D783740